MNSVPERRAPSVSLLTATAIVIADMIGIGVFTSLGFQVGDIPSGFAIALLWTVGGIAALCGALSYGELAAALPRSGGEYHFLSQAFHPSVGFLAGWISATVGFAAPVALAAMAFGEYLKGIFPALSPLVASLAIVWLIALVHITDMKIGSAFQNSFTLLKVALLIALIVAGCFVADPQPISFLPKAGDSKLIFAGPFAVSLVYVMYSYSGWNASTYIVSEVRDAHRNVPRSLLLGTAVVMVLYVAVNAVFLHTTPLPEMAGKVQVGLIAGRHIFGTSGGNVMGALICIGLISSISSMTWIGPRVTMAMGEDLAALRWFALKTGRGIPFVAILTQLAIVSVLLFTSTFERVVVYVQLALILSSFLAVLGVIVLRFTQPNLPRPYKTWGYPITPVVFLAISLFMMYYTVINKPVESLAGLGTMLLGLIVYFLSPKKTPQPSTS